VGHRRARHGNTGGLAQGHRRALRVSHNSISVLAIRYTNTRTGSPAHVIIQLSPGDARPIYVQIMDEIRRAIVVGTLRADEPLPSVRQLAGELRVNPNTVMQAYRELERDGAVHVRRGQGTYVSSNGTSVRERQRLVSDVAARAIRDAHRHGLSAEELIEEIRRTAGAASAINAAVPQGQEP
jgi:GntR family transcriptional regulator